MCQLTLSGITGRTQIYRRKRIQSMVLPRGSYSAIHRYSCWCLQCFAHCYSLRRVDFVEPSTTTEATAMVELREFVFNYCRELRSVRLPQNMVSIPVSCFNHCRSLIDVPIPVKVRGIRSGSFRGCTSLTSIACNDTIVVGRFALGT